MAVSATINTAPTISSGTATVYAQSNWPYGTSIAGAPVGASVTTGSVGTDGSVTFSGLTASTMYVAYQASPDRYVRFRSPAAAAASAATPTQIVFASGRYYFTPNSGLAGIATTNQRLTATPFLVPVATTFDRIGLHVTVGVASTTIRLGIYDTLAGVPNSLILDGGTIDSSTGGAKENNISQALSAGLYWLATLANGGAPTIVQRTGGSLAGIGGATLADLSGQVGGYYRDIASGALPATFGAATVTGNSPLPGLRAV